MWGNQANCYAYACNCKAPANGIYGAAVPGGYAKKGVFVRPGETVAVYTERLIQGVLLDAAKNSLRHAVVSTQIVLLCHKFFRSKICWQHGQRGSVREIARAMAMRTEVIEFGT
jgi:hypothetical protein